MSSLPDMPVNVPIDDPNADTEWNDILRKHKIIPEKPPTPTKLIEEAYVEAARLMHENRLEGKDLDELDELEDEEDDAFLEIYRQKRMKELNRIHTSPHGSVYPLTKAEYTKMVTEASMNEVVLVALYSESSGQPESRVLRELWREAAGKFPDVKFCEMRAGLAIEKYPESNCPTVLVYEKGDIVRQVVTLREWGGAGETRLENIERLLVEVKAIKPEDYRLRRKGEEEELAEEEKRARSSIKFGAAGKSRGKAADEDDDDWD
ncbi:thioredoxin-like protein [Terfezia boudieri ATCC MYA-4762]|uniref:Thioredoxin-like protein n=1 Tax=Terfezia boudieri ATCC MYA-4762 TaxID=1051890 RepID=A0A3N4L9B2_9PEZI|nr:thioredoxin-like protein [Terfezia boudieri ATCC MYA-4762]